jgi:hypothetical protein
MATHTSRPIEGQQPHSAMSSSTLPQRPTKIDTESKAPLTPPGLVSVQLPGPANSANSIVGFHRSKMYDAITPTPRTPSDGSPPLVPARRAA